MTRFRTFAVNLKGWRPCSTVTSDTTESMIAKDMRANNFYGLKPSNVIFVNQPSLPGHGRTLLLFSA